MHAQGRPGNATGLAILGADHDAFESHAQRLKRRMRWRSRDRCRALEPLRCFVDATRLEQE